MSWQCDELAVINEQAMNDELAVNNELVVMSWQQLWQGTGAHNLLDLKNERGGEEETPKNT